MLLFLVSLAVSIVDLSSNKDLMTESVVSRCYFIVFVVGVLVLIGERSPNLGKFTCIF